MTTQRLLRLLSLSALLFTVAAPAAESLSVRLQKAIFAEETEGNLEAAIKIYQEIVDETEANKTVAAQAQYRLGLCRLKQGKQAEASAAFRRLIEQFADASDLVAKGRERLAEMGQPLNGVVTRQVQVHLGKATPNRLSSDGRLLSSIDWATGDLWLRDLQTGANRKLTHSSGWTNNAEHSVNSAFSWDGKQIAYDWWNQSNECYEVRLMSIHEPKPKVLAGDSQRSFNVGDWSPDGKFIAVTALDRTNRESSVSTISLIGAEDGVLRDLVSLDAATAASFRFSPDGRYLAYDLAPDPRRAHTEPAATAITNGIYVLDVRNGAQKKLVDARNKERFLDWAPQGSQILFSSERRGTIDIWSLDVGESGGVGQPVLVKPNLGDVEPLGITRDGAFCYSTRVAFDELYVAEVDMETGDVLSPPRAVLGQELDQNPYSLSASWSPNGRFIAASGGEDKASSICIVEWQTGKKRKFLLGSDSRGLLGGRGSMIQWMPDSSAVAARAMSADSAARVYLLDVGTGALKEVLSDTKDHRHQFPEPFGALDGQALFVIRNAFGGEGWALVRKDLESGTETELDIPQPKGARPSHFCLRPDKRSILYLRTMSPGGDRVAVFHDLGGKRHFELMRSPQHITIRHSPDGERVALLARRAEGDAFIRVFALSGDEPQQLYEIDFPKNSGLLQWTVDGRYLLCITKIDAAKATRVQLHRIFRDTGQIKPTQLAWTAIRGVDAAGLFGIGVFASPDNKHVHFVERYQSPTELWMLENFLPPIASSK